MQRARPMSERDHMNSRIHEYLDGNVPLSALAPDEAARARRLERAIAELRDDATRFGDVDLVPDVMSRIGAGPPASVTERDVRSRRSSAARVGEWLLGKRRLSFTLRPIYAAAAAVLLLVAGLQWDLVAGSGGEARTAGGEPEIYVRFEIRAPEAQSVQLAGSFSNWSPEISLDRLENGRWVAFVPLRPGVHDYAFRVDGERWLVDPSAPRVADGFGGFNSRLSLVIADS